MSERTSAELTPKRIYLALDDHTDYMWSADEAAYQQAFLEMLDYYIEQAGQTSGNLPDFQSRFNADGNFWAWVYEQNRSPDAFNRLMACIRSGHISLPLNPLILTYGGAPLEAVIRGMYYAGSLERRFNLRFPLVLAMENQTMPFGLGALWAGCGAKFSWKGICACASRMVDAWDRPHDIYWWEGQDGSRILMKWNSLLGNNKSLGGYAEARDPQASLEFVTTDPEFQRRYPYDVIGIFGKGWDDLKTLTQEFVTFAQNNSTPEQRIIVSNEVDFFEDFIARYGPVIPSEGCSYGNEWDLYTASISEVFASVRRAVEKLRTAEALSVLTGLIDPAMQRAYTAIERQEAWMDLGLVYEHDLTADGPITRDERAAWHRKKSERVIQYSEELHSVGLRSLGQQIQFSGDVPRFFAFNPLSWARTGAVDLAYSEEGPCHVVDLTTGNEVPMQWMEREGQAVLQILAENVPPVGYKVFEVRPGQGAAFASAAQGSENIWENEFFRISLSENGAILSWIDKTSGGRELASQINGRLINDLGAGSARIRVEHCGQVSITILVEADEPVAHTRRYTLVRGQRQIDIRNEITENFGETHAWAFSFNLKNPDVWHEEVGAVIRAKLVGDGGHYAPTCARYDWLTLNHFADMSAGDGKVGITLANSDCAFMQLGNSTVQQLDTCTPQLRVLAGGQIDGPGLGITNQGGDRCFIQRFSLTAHQDYDSVKAMRFALEHQNPLTSGPVLGGGIYNDKQYSLLTIDHPGVLLWALKPAEDGWHEGLVARLWNLTSNQADFTLKLNDRRIDHAMVLTHIETPLREAATRDGALFEHLAPNQIGTFALI